MELPRIFASMELTTPWKVFFREGSVDPPINYGGASDQSAHRGTLGAGIEYLSRCLESLLKI